MTAAITTVGHSNRSLAEFVELLREAHVGLVIDVRSFPRSRSNPAFNIDTLPDELAACRIDYRHAPDLGGRRRARADVDDDVNGLWRNRSFHNYADHALGVDFAAALDEVIALSRDRRLALMCAEAVWWRCHRRIIADHLLLGGHAVEHLMGPGRNEEARPTPGATRRDDGKVVYPAPDGDQQV